MTNDDFNNTGDNFLSNENVLANNYSDKNHEGLSLSKIDHSVDDLLYGRFSVNPVKSIPPALPLSKTGNLSENTVNVFFKIISWSILFFFAFFFIYGMLLG